MNGTVYHVPALCREAVDLLMTDAGGAYVDGTVGGGGHAVEICSRLQGPGRLLCLDADDEALASARTRLAGFAARTTFVRTNFRFLRDAMQEAGWTGASGILLDLGISSHQIDAVERGFTFRGDERLDMRMDRRQPLSAWDIVNTYDERALADVIYRFGEEQNARRIARSIVAHRPVHTTGELRDVVAAFTPDRFLNKSLARVFQALRIEVNDELGVLESLLRALPQCLRSGGRAAVLTFHSGEDRRVKKSFESGLQRGVYSAASADVIRASSEERHANPRASSAKLRWVRRS